MTVEQVWSFGEKEKNRYYCPFIWGAEELTGKGKVLACFGGMLSDDDGNVTDNPQTELGRVRIVEVTHEAGARLVFELFIDECHKGKGWEVNRARRLPALYG